MQYANSTPPKMAFLFKGGRRARLAQDGDFPTEFFYGYVQIAKAGHDVSILESSDFGIGEKMPLLWTVVSTLVYGITGLQPYAIWRFMRPTALKTFNAYDSVVVSTTAFGVSLALLKAVGLFRPKLYFIVMGALDFTTSPLRRFIVTRLLQKNMTITISKGDMDYLATIFSDTSNLRYLPFGIDNAFWCPEKQQDTALREEYVLSIGNDSHRDYETLIKAWKPEYPALKIITRLDVPKAGENVLIIRGDWNLQVMSDSDIRDLYRHSLFVVLPIRTTAQPSGQSACLQAMSCGKAVILSDTPGLWDRDLMVSDQSCILVEAGSVLDLQSKIESALSDRDRLDHIGENAQAVIDQHLNTQIMAERLSDFLSLDAGGEPS